MSTKLAALRSQLLLGQFFNFLRKILVIVEESTGEIKPIVFSETELDFNVVKFKKSHEHNRF